MAKLLTGFLLHFLVVLLMASDFKVAQSLSGNQMPNFSSSGAFQS